MNDKLRIFVSGKEGELDHEREIAIEQIVSFGFEPVSSENRTASCESMETEFRDEVRTSDIYIGIFGSAFSKPTINEFNTARANNVCALVFEKDVSDKEELTTEYTKFLTEIKDPKSGLVVSKYKNADDLKEKIRAALSYNLTRKFKFAQQLQREKTEKENKRVNEDIEKQNKDAALLSKMQKFPFGTRFSKEFGKAEFTDFRILSALQKGKKHVVTAKIKGSTKIGFLDLAIKIPDEGYHWFPDPRSWDSALDTGKLFLDGGVYEAQWEFSIPDKSGKYLFVMGLYENNFANRETVNYEMQEIMVD